MSERKLREEFSAVRWMRHGPGGYVVIEGGIGDTTLRRTQLVEALDLYRGWLIESGALLTRERATECALAALSELKEYVRRQSTWEDNLVRCASCGCPYAINAKEGCIPGNCSQRPGGLVREPMRYAIECVSLEPIAIVAMESHEPSQRAERRNHERRSQSRAQET